MAEDQFNRLGFPGEYNEVESVTGNTWFTGSRIGAAAIIRGTDVSGSVVLNAGGSIDLEDLDAGIIHEIGILRTLNVGGGNFYVLKRRS